MNGRLYDPLLRRFLNADENIQDPNNTQNYNKYGYVMNNPLMYNDPNGEFFVFLGLGVLFWKAVIIGAAVGLASYTLGLGVTGNLSKWSIGGALKATFFGAVGGAATFGIGSIFSSSSGTLTAIGKALGDARILVQGAAHAISQGTLSLMQGGSFWSGAAAGFLGHMGGELWGATMKGVGLDKFAQSTMGMVTFGAISGGIGAELSGGNFWQGAVTGGIVAGLNGAMHKIEVKSPKDIIILNASDGAGGKGHSGMIIGNDKDGYIYMASDGRVDSSGSTWMGGKNDTTVKTFKTRQEAMDFAKTQYHYDDSITIKTTAKQDLGAATRAMKQLQSNYHFLFNNCNHIISAALTGAGLSQYGGYSVIPNSNFQELKNNFRKK